MPLDKRLFQLWPGRAGGTSSEHLRLLGSVERIRPLGSGGWILREASRERLQPLWTASQRKCKRPKGFSKVQRNSSSKEEERLGCDDTQRGGKGRRRNEKRSINLCAFSKYNKNKQKLYCFFYLRKCFHDNMEYQTYDSGSFHVYMEWTLASGKFLVY